MENINNHKKIPNMEDFIINLLYGDKTDIDNQDTPKEAVRNIPKNYSIAMRTDAYIDKNGMTNIVIELPGFQKEEIDIYLENSILTISANKVETETDDKKYLMRERKMSYKRSFSVPADRKVEDFNVTYENGILHIQFCKEKPEDKVNRKIKIN